MKKKVILFMVIITFACMATDLLADILYIKDGDVYGTVSVPSTRTVEMTGGEVGCFDMDGGTVNVYGGTLNGSSIRVWSGSTFNMSGGTNTGVGEIGCYGGTINISGGETGVVMNGWGGGTVNISGGDWEDFIYAYDDGNVNIYGYNLNLTTSGGTQGDGQVTGFWQDDTPFTINLYNAEPVDLTWHHIVLHEVPVEQETLTVCVEPNDVGIDTITPSIGQHGYNINQMVLISAGQFIDCPDIYQFAHWEGDVTDANSANTTIFMDSNETITAVFVDDRQCGDECHPDDYFGDYNHDCIINVEDFAEFALNWLVCTKPECD